MLSRLEGLRVSSRRLSRRQGFSANVWFAVHHSPRLATCPPASALFCTWFSAYSGLTDPVGLAKRSKDLSCPSGASASWGNKLQIYKQYVGPRDHLESPKEWHLTGWGVGMGSKRAGVSSEDEPSRPGEKEM